VRRIAGRREKPSRGVNTHQWAPMRYLAVITLLILALTLVQPVAAQSYKAGVVAKLNGDYAIREDLRFFA